MSEAMDIKDEDTRAEKQKQRSRNTECRHNGRSNKEHKERTSSVQSKGTTKIHATLALPLVGAEQFAFEPVNFSDSSQFKWLWCANELFVIVQNEQIAYQ